VGVMLRCHDRFEIEISVAVALTHYFAVLETVRENVLTCDISEEDFVYHWSAAEIYCQCTLVSHVMYSKSKCICGKSVTRKEI